MQSQYMSVELLENIKKNSDLSVMKEQFEKDMSDAYLEIRSKTRKRRKKAQQAF
jgi:hypothetical protein